MPPLLHTLISSGSKVSGDVDIRRYPKLQYVMLPTMTSGDTYLQGNSDTTSAGFRRLADNVGQIANATGLGSTVVLFPGGYQTPPYLRLESLVTQTDNRSIVFAVR